MGGSGEGKGAGVLIPIGNALACLDSLRKRSGAKHGMGLVV